jgi:hypothetical protein
MALDAKRRTISASSLRQYFFFSCSTDAARFFASARRDTPCPLERGGAQLFRHT